MIEHHTKEQFSPSAIETSAPFQESIQSATISNLSRLRDQERQNEHLQNRNILPHCIISGQAIESGPTASHDVIDGPASHQFSVESNRTISYKVTSGDTVWAIARDALAETGRSSPSDQQVALEVQKIVKASALQDPDLIYPGQVLTIATPTDLCSESVEPAVPPDTSSLAPILKVTSAALTATPTQDATNAIGDPNTYFFTQFYDARWNPDGPSASLNCGPASLAMAFKHLGKGPPGADSNDPEKFIEQTRIAMTGSNDNTETTFDQIIHGAQAGGLHAEQVTGLQGVQSALEGGQMVVAAGNPETPGAYGNRLTNDQYAYYNGDHVILIVGQKGNDFIVNDPLSRSGSITVNAAELQAFLSVFGTNNGGIAVAS